MRKIRSHAEFRRISNAQSDWIEARFGKDVKANDGWYSNDYTWVTKVYGQGIVTSYIVGNEIIHEFDGEEGLEEVYDAEIAWLRTIAGRTA